MTTRFRRTYSLNEVHQLLYQSESRSSPTSGKMGHSLNLHADMRQDITDHRRGRKIHLAQTVDVSRTMDPAHSFTVIHNYAPGRDSRFTSRKDLIIALQQGLNSTIGQTELGNLDANPGLNRISFRAPLIKPVKDIERYIKSTSTTETGKVAHAIQIVIDRIPGTPGSLHIQTAYPEEVRDS